MFNNFIPALRPKSKFKHFDKIRIEYGEILAQDDCNGLLFFMTPNLKWGGGLNKAVLAKAGQGLDDYVCNNVTTPHSGEVFQTPPFDTSYQALFLGILADWDGGNGFEERDLLECYRKTVSKAQDLGLKNLAIPAMGRDKRDFPHVRFARLALQGILEELDDRLDFVKIVCIDHTMIRTYNEQIEKMKKRES